MKLLLVRHGQTDFNKNKIPQGQEIDASLNETGIQQAREAATFLPTDIDFIMCSPLKRTRETAEILNDTLKKEIEFNDDIKELSYGSLAGKTWPEIRVLLGIDEAAAHHKDQHIEFDYRKFNGECAADLKSRVSRFVADVQEKYSDKNILVVTHGGVIDTMHILFPRKERSEADNGTIHEFIF